MKKLPMKKTEARILLYLNEADMKYRYVVKIANKLEMEYGFALRTLSSMCEKEWVRKMRHTTRTYYSLTTKAPMELAKQSNIIIKKEDK